MVVEEIVLKGPDQSTILTFEIRQAKFAVLVETKILELMNARHARASCPLDQ